jgi:hypothetical protein
MRTAAKTGLAGQLAQKLLFIHVVLEGFAAIDEDDGDFVVVLAAEIGVGVYVDVLPGEAATAGELRQALFHYFTQVASLAGIDHDAAGIRHAGF